MTSTATEPDLFDAATTTYVEIGDVDGRLICVFGHRIAQANGKNGDPYDYVEADVLVLDGPVTEKIDQVPTLIEGMRLSAAKVVDQLRTAVRKGRPVLGRVNSKPSQFNKHVPAYGLAEPTDADKALARPVVADHIAKSKPKNDDPFAAA